MLTKLIPISIFFLFWFTVDGFENSTFIKVNSEAKLTKGVSMPAIPGQVKVESGFLFDQKNHFLQGSFQIVV